MPESTVDRRSKLSSRLVTPLAAAVVLAQITYPLVDDGAGRRAVTLVVVVLFAATSLAHAAVTRGIGTASTLAAVCGVGGLAAEAVGVATGVPFGGYEYTGTLGPQALGVPVVIPLAWIMMAWPAYLVGSGIADWVGAGRSGWAFRRPLRVVLAAWALAAWDLFLDPQMVDAGYWRWDDPSPSLPGVSAVPVSNYVGWLAVSLLMMTALDAALTRLHRERGDADPVLAAGGAPDRLPYALYVWTWLSSVLAHAAFFGLHGSAVLGGIGMGLIAVPLLRSLRPARVRTR